MYDLIMSPHDQVLGGGIYWKEGDKGSKNTCSKATRQSGQRRAATIKPTYTYLRFRFSYFNFNDKKIVAGAGLLLASAASYAQKQPTDICSNFLSAGVV